MTPARTVFIGSGGFGVQALRVLAASPDVRIVGIVTDRDLALGVIGEGRFDARVGDVMTPNPSTVRESDDVESVSRLMAEQQIRRVPVVNDRGAVVGMIAQADLALAESGVTDRTVGEVVERISQPEGSGPGSSRA